MKNLRSWKTLWQRWRKGEEIEFNIDLSFETVVTIIVGILAILWLVLK